MSRQRRVGWGLVAAASALGVLMLGLAFLLRTADLANLAYAAQVVGVFAVFAPLVASAFSQKDQSVDARRDQPNARQDPFADALRTLTQRYQISRSELRKRLTKWNEDAVDSYLDGTDFPSWEFVVELLRLINVGPWRRRKLAQELRPDGRLANLPHLLLRISQTGALFSLPASAWLLYY